MFEAIAHDFEQEVTLVANLILEVLFDLVNVLLHRRFLLFPMLVDHGAKVVVDVLG